MDLNEYKAKVKKENLKFFFTEAVNRKYSMEDKVNALLGIGENPGIIKAHIQKLKADQMNKEAEIDACNSIEEVNAILGVMKHD